MHYNNKALINYYGRLQLLVLIFKFPMAMQQTFFELCGQFGTYPQ
jgi:hypothetical protein